MLNRGRSPGTSSLIRAICIAAGLLVLGVILLTEPYTVDAHFADARSREMQLVSALRNYHTEYGSFPEGDYPAVIRVLVGNNPHKIVFLEFKAKEKGPQGEWLDPWGTPFRVDLSNPSGPRASSAGKNKKFEPDSPDSDDVCSWRDWDSAKSM